MSHRNKPIDKAPSSPSSPRVNTERQTSLTEKMASLFHSPLLHRTGGGGEKGGGGVIDGRNNGTHAKRMNSAAEIQERLSREEMKEEKQRRREIKLASLDPDFYKSEEEFDSVRRVLLALPQNFVDEDVEKEEERLREIVEIVSSNLSKQVLDRYEDFVSGMNVISNLAHNLNTSGVVVKNGRRVLARAQGDVASALKIAESQVRDAMRCVYLGMQKRRRCNQSFLGGAVTRPSCSPTICETKTLDVGVLTRRIFATLSQEKKRAMLSTVDVLIRYRTSQALVAAANAEAEAAAQTFHHGGHRSHHGGSGGGSGGGGSYAAPQVVPLAPVQTTVTHPQSHAVTPPPMHPPAPVHAAAPPFTSHDPVYAPVYAGAGHLHGARDRAKEAVAREREAAVAVAHAKPAPAPVPPTHALL